MKSLLISTNSFINIFGWTSVVITSIILLFFIVKKYVLRKKEKNDIKKTTANIAELKKIDYLKLSYQRCGEVYLYTYSSLFIYWMNNDLLKAKVEKDKNITFIKNKNIDSSFPKYQQKLFNKLFKNDNPNAEIHIHDSIIYDNNNNPYIDEDNEQAKKSGKFVDKNIAEMKSEYKKFKPRYSTSSILYTGALLLVMYILTMIPRYFYYTSITSHEDKSLFVTDIMVLTSIFFLAIISMCKKNFASTFIEALKILAIFILIIGESFLYNNTKLDPFRLIEVSTILISFCHICFEGSMNSTENSYKVDLFVKNIFYQLENMDIEKMEALAKDNSQIFYELLPYLYVTEKNKQLREIACNPKLNINKNIILSEDIAQKENPEIYFATIVQIHRAFLYFLCNFTKTYDNRAKNDILTDCAIDLLSRAIFFDIF